VQVFLGDEHPATELTSDKLAGPNSPYTASRPSPVCAQTSATEKAARPGRWLGIAIMRSILLRTVTYDGGCLDRLICSPMSCLIKVGEFIAQPRARVEGVRLLIVCV
jgi:hypothetical protein